MSVTKFSDHVTRALSRLAQQLQDSATHRALWTLIGEQMQEVENALWDVRILRDIGLASGTQLDALGAIVGAERDGRSDVLYRLRIRAEILANRSSGELNTLYTIGRLMLPTATVRIVEQFPAALEIFVENDTLTDVAEFTRYMQRAKAAGIGLIVRYQDTTDPATLFAFEDLVDGGPGLGFGDINNPATGGKLTGALS